MYVHGVVCICGMYMWYVYVCGRFFCCLSNLYVVLCLFRTRWYKRMKRTWLNSFSFPKSQWNYCVFYPLLNYPGSDCAQCVKSEHEVTASPHRNPAHTIPLLSSFWKPGLFVLLGGWPRGRSLSLNDLCIRERVCSACLSDWGPRCLASHP